MRLFYHISDELSTPKQGFSEKGGAVREGECKNRLPTRFYV